jgi:hypothetical protein
LQKSRPSVVPHNVFDCRRRGTGFEAALVENSRAEEQLFECDDLGQCIVKRASTGKKAKVSESRELHVFRKCAIQKSFNSRDSFFLKSALLNYIKHGKIAPSRHRLGASCPRYWLNVDQMRLQQRSFSTLYTQKPNRALADRNPRISNANSSGFPSTNILPQASVQTKGRRDCYL